MLQSALKYHRYPVLLQYWSHDSHLSGDQGMMKHIQGDAQAKNVNFATDQQETRSISTGQ